MKAYVNQPIKKVLKKVPQYNTSQTPNLEESPLIQKRGKGLRASEVDFKQIIPEADTGKRFTTSFRKNATPTPSSIETELSSLTHSGIERHQSLQMDKNLFPKNFNDYGDHS